MVIIIQVEKQKKTYETGNIITKNNKTTGTFIDHKITLKGKNSIIGRSIIVHDLKDDLGKGKMKNH